MSRIKLLVKVFVGIASLLIFLTYISVRPNFGGRKECVKWSGLNSIKDLNLEEKKVYLWSFKYPSYWVYKVSEDDVPIIKSETKQLGYNDFSDVFFQIGRLHFESVECCSKGRVHIFFTKVESEMFLYIAHMPR